MEIEKKITKKERFLIWWKKGGNIECFVAFVALIILVFYGNNPLIAGITICSVALWGFGKLFFKKEHRYFVFIMSVWLLYRGILEILSYYRG